MTQILHVSNPFNPTDGLRRWETSRKLTIRKTLQMMFGKDFVEFDIPTVCQVNGKAIMRAQWGKLKLMPGDTVVFIALPGDAVTIIISVIALVVSVIAVLLMPDPKNPTQENPETVNNLRGQYNRLRLGEPIESHYGKVKTWPSYAAPPYSKYENNDQFQFSLFCLGQGSYSIEGTFFDDSPTSSFPEVEIEIIPPGQPITLFNSNVSTAAEVSNLELIGPNQEEFEILGGYAISAADIQVRKIEVDIVAPQGLYSLSAEGNMQSLSVEVLFQARKIDADGAPIGAWFTIISETMSATTNTPQRWTFAAVVTKARYEIRGQRVDETSDDTGIAESLVWESAKGYSPTDATYPGLTMIAVKARATNSLNNSTAQKFNVKMTRELPIWDGTEWSEPTATRNPVWACLDVFRSEYGGRLADEYLDLPGFLDLAEDLNTAETWFDYSFDQRLVIWEAAKMTLAVANATPLPQGSLISAVRDNAANLPAAIFNQHNIVKESLTKSLDLYTFDDFDSVEVEYIHPNTWKPETVIASLPGRTRDNPEKITLPGCTSRKRAYRWGMRFRANREKRRKSVKFRTGLEGHIPSYMDLVSVSHPTLRVGFGGLVVAYDTLTKVVTMSDAVTFLPGRAHSILFRGSDGAALGVPISCGAGETSNKVVLAVDPAEEFDFSPNQLPPFYAFGVDQLWSFKGKVVNVDPQDESTVEITLINYDSTVYDYDNSNIDELPEPVYISTPLLPIVAGARLSSATPTFTGAGQGTWNPATGAAYYRVQISIDDGASWSLLTDTTLTHVPVSLLVGPNKIRVAGVSGGGIGPWSESNSLVGLIIGEDNILNEDGSAAINEDNSAQQQES